MSVNASCDLIINCQPATNYERNAAACFDASFRLWNLKVEVYYFQWAQVRTLSSTVILVLNFSFTSNLSMRNITIPKISPWFKRPESSCSSHFISQLYWQLIDAFNNICIDSPLDKLGKQLIYVSSVTNLVSQPMTFKLGIFPLRDSTVHIILGKYHPSYCIFFHRGWLGATDQADLSPGATQLWVLWRNIYPKNWNLMYYYANYWNSLSLDRVWDRKGKT